jgi:hypothetical protein
MATFKRATLHSPSGNFAREILINEDLIRYMRPNQNGSTTVHFDSEHSVNIDEPPDTIAMLAPVL